MRVENLGERAPRGQRDDEIDLRHPGQGFALPLGEASGDDERRARVFTPQTPHEAPAVALGAIRDRAAVHEEDLRFLGGRGHFSADTVRDRRGVDPADLAPDRHAEDAPRDGARGPVR